MTINIEKGVNIPKVTRVMTSKIRDALSTLETGDSFFMEGKTVNQAHGKYGAAGRQLGIKLVVRTVEGGVRIWRV